MSYTINPNAKNKWARNAENTMDLSIETDASSVYLDNGRTLEQELGEGSMVSNVATVDNSMSKVIDGTLDGAYESCVFKGKSLVNLVEKPTSANVGNSKKWNGYGGGNPSKTFITNGIRLTNTQYGSIVLDYFDLSLFKPNTKYTLFIDVYHNGEGATPMLDKIAGTGQYAIPLENGHNCIVFTSVSDLTAAKMGIRFGCTGSTSESCVYEFSNIVIVEGDHSSINPDYFEGLCDVKMPVLRNVGKNLLSPSYIQRVYFGVTVGSPIVIHQSPSGAHSSIVKYPCKVGDTYTLTYASGNADRNIVIELDINDVVLKTSTTRTNTYTVANNNTKKLCWYIGQDIANPIPSNAIMLETGEQQTGFEDYKTNILRTSEEIVLREVNGVQDTYNPLTGEYVKRIGEKVLCGETVEDWRDFRNTFIEKTETIDVYLINPEQKSNSNLLCDKMRTTSKGTYMNDEEGISCSGGSGLNVWVSISKNKLSTPNKEGFKQWLQSNPMTIQYELAEPIATIVEPSTIPFAYENGHIILESGSEEQSLLPTLEYSTVVNRAGQVESVAKVIQKQEKQLTMLEKMLIQNIISLDYNNTLLTLKNEMEEML